MIHAFEHVLIKGLQYWKYLELFSNNTYSKLYIKMCFVKWFVNTGSSCI